MNKLKIVINSTIIKEMFLPLLFTTMTILMIIIMTIILVNKSLKRSDNNEKK